MIGGSKSTMPVPTDRRPISANGAAAAGPPAKPLGSGSSGGVVSAKAKKKKSRGGSVSGGSIGGTRLRKSADPSDAARLSPVRQPQKHVAPSGANVAEKVAKLQGKMPQVAKTQGRLPYDARGKPKAKGKPRKPSPKRIISRRCVDEKGIPRALSAGTLRKTNVVRVFVYHVISAMISHLAELHWYLLA